MSSSKTLNNLNIRKFPSKASFKNATNIGEDDLCVVAGSGEPLMQFETMPTAGAEWEGQVVQYIGQDGDYVHGYIYRCYNDNENYYWGIILVQPQEQPCPTASVYGVNVSNSTKQILIGNEILHDDVTVWRPFTYFVYILDNAYQGGNKENVFIASITCVNTDVYQQRIYKATGIFANAKCYLCGYTDSAYNIGICNGDGEALWSGSADIYLTANMQFYGTAGTTVSEPRADNSRYSIYEEIPENKSVEQFNTLPTIDVQNLGQIAQYIGATDSSYTNGYFYKATGTPNPVAASFDVTETTETGTTITINDINGLIEYIATTFGFTWYEAIGRLGFGYTWEYNEPEGILLWNNQDVTGALQYFDFSPAVSGNLVMWTTENYVPAHIDVLNSAWERVDLQPSSGGVNVNTTVTLAVADWSNNEQTVTVSGVKADSVVFVSPAPASASDYASAGILCTAQAADSLTFTCTTTPSNAINVNVVCM